MAWDLTENRTRTEIGKITLDISDPDGTNPNRSISGLVLILDQNGDVMKKWSGDLMPHLLATEKAQLAAILDALRLRAQTQLIGL